MDDLSTAHAQTTLQTFGPPTPPHFVDERPLLSRLQELKSHKIDTPAYELIDRSRIGQSDYTIMKDGYPRLVTASVAAEIERTQLGNCQRHIENNIRELVMLLPVMKDVDPTQHGAMRRDVLEVEMKYAELLGKMQMRLQDRRIRVDIHDFIEVEKQSSALRKNNLDFAIDVVEKRIESNTETLARLDRDRRERELNRKRDEHQALKKKTTSALETLRNEIATKPFIAPPLEQPEEPEEVVILSKNPRQARFESTFAALEKEARKHAKLANIDLLLTPTLQTRIAELEHLSIPMLQALAKRETLTPMQIMQLKLVSWASEYNGIRGRRTEFDEANMDSKMEKIYALSHDMRNRLDSGSELSLLTVEEAMGLFDKGIHDRAMQSESIINNMEETTRLALHSQANKGDNMAPLDYALGLMMDYSKRYWGEGSDTLRPGYSKVGMNNFLSPELRAGDPFRVEQTYWQTMRHEFVLSNIAAALASVQQDIEPYIKRTHARSKRENFCCTVKIPHDMQGQIYARIANAQEWINYARRIERFDSKEGAAYAGIDLTSAVETKLQNMVCECLGVDSADTPIWVSKDQGWGDLSENLNRLLDSNHRFEGYSFTKREQEKPLEQREPGTALMAKFMQGLAISDMPAGFVEGIEMEIDETDSYPDYMARDLRDKFQIRYPGHSIDYPLYYDAQGDKFKLLTAEGFEEGFRNTKDVLKAGRDRILGVTDRVIKRLADKLPTDEQKSHVQHVLAERAKDDAQDITAITENGMKL